VDLKNSKNLNPNLEKEIKQKYPHLLKPNYEIKECNDEKKRIFFEEYIEKISAKKQQV